MKWRSGEMAGGRLAIKGMMLCVGASILLAGCGGNEPDKTVIIPPDEMIVALEAGEYDRIYDGLTADFRKEFSRNDFIKAVKGFSEDVKAWHDVSELKLNNSHYKTWRNDDTSKGLSVILTENGEMISFKMMPLQTYPESDQAFTKLTYSLPLTEDWFVFWGGENVMANYHYEYESQRYAYDLIQVKDGFSYKGDPTKNESYYAFGKDITAPHAGKVVHVVSDIPDNEPVGTMNDKQPAGNVVIIDHGDGEFSYLAHLKKDSVTVKVGDSVEKGDIVGLSGNSGNSSEAHLHFQVSDGDDLFASKSLRIKWENDLHPVQGETLNR
jgi:murein DD-endopeptidase MepM/ murein hydrolase activator NlpD